MLKYIIYAGVAYFIYTKLSDSYSSIDDFKVELNWIWLVIAIFIFSFHNIWNGFNWYYLVKSSGEDVRRRDQIEVYMKSYIMRYIPGNVVGIMARGIYNKKYNVPMVKSLWGWFFENIIYLGLGILIGLYVVLVSDGDTGRNFVEVVASKVGLSQQVATFLTYLGLTGGASIGILVLFRNEWLRQIFNKVLVPRLPDGAREDFEALRIPLRSRLILALRYLVAWGIYSISFMSLAYGFGVDDFGSLLAAASANAMAWSIGYLAIVTPSGTGIREAAMVVFLTGAVMLGDDTAVMISLFARFVFIIGELFGFAQYFVFKLFLQLNDGEIR